MKLIYKILLLEFIVVSTACSEAPAVKEDDSKTAITVQDKPLVVKINTANSDEFNVNIPQTGRYTLHFFGKGHKEGYAWLEDYIHNEDDRTYNISGAVQLNDQGMGSIDGSPLAEGEHSMRIHLEGEIDIDSIKFELLVGQKETPQKLTQSMEGEEWSLVWSDEFEGEGLPDSTKWSYNIGNWGWGNNELQYYTKAKLENARQENGSLIIEAHKNADNKYWSSARLTTQAKTSFLYGKIEFRAKVPEGRGTWAAGWLLGDTYRDEISWPYCGEIDVLECVGYEIDDSTGKGLNHSTCHTRAYYFKQGNQIGSEIELDSMNTKFHTYAVEWYPDVIHGYLDGEHYYTYDKNANEQEWPFHQAQNIIINLAIGGGWGGAQGIDENYDSHQYILDYVRVYEKK